MMLQAHTAYKIKHQHILTPNALNIMQSTSVTYAVSTLTAFQLPFSVVRHNVLKSIKLSAQLMLYMFYTHN